MSILIRGMEAPKSCEECNFSAGGYCLAKSLDFLNWRVVNDSPRPSWCPIIGIPDMYIDIAKAFMTELTDKICIKEEEDGH